MTPPWREYIPCPACGAQVSTEQPFDAWVRLHDQLDSVKDGINITDGDKIVHRYMVRTGGVRDKTVQYLMSLEVKAFEADMKLNQKDTLHIWNQLIRTVHWKTQRDKGRFTADHQQNVAVVYSVLNGQKIQINSYGVHVLRLSHGSPDDSEWMTWDGKRIHAGELVRLLRFELHPDSLREMENRHHKKTPPRQPLLFGGG